MGVNMAGNCIIDDEACCEASRQEIIRRYYKSCAALLTGTGKEDEVRKIELLLKQAHASLEDRRVVPASLQKELETEAPAAALELPDGRIIYGQNIRSARRIFRTSSERTERTWQESITNIM